MRLIEENQRVKVMFLSSEVHCCCWALRLDPSFVKTYGGIRNVADAKIIRLIPTIVLHANTVWNSLITITSLDLKYFGSPDIKQNSHYSPTGSLENCCIVGNTEAMKITLKNLDNLSPPMGCNSSPEANEGKLGQLVARVEAEVDDHELLIQESPNGCTLEAETQTQTVRVQFRLQRECSFGQNFLITGDHPILGSWDPNNAISLTWSDSHIWTADIDIPVGRCFKFKLVMQESDGKFVWQPGPDRVLEGCFQTDKIITLCEDWENPDSRIVMETDPTTNQFVEPSQEPEGYAICMEEELVSDEVVPVLIPGLSQLSVNQGPEDEPEPVNGAAVVATGPDMAQDLTLPELESKDDIANASDLNPRPEISLVNENQESCEIKHQEMQVTEEQDHEATQPMTSLLHNDVQWSNNVMQKFLNILGIQ
ncbi:uncharacterized protein LOC143633875 [Bidens hawaiensis]|uniref:uncharacterized protein LOC143633875 n=1 Tax=Bidens hawaiensis TaxID=980011 RepID=UPI00404916B4